MGASVMPKKQAYGRDGKTAECARRCAAMQEPCMARMQGEKEARQGSKMEGEGGREGKVEKAAAAACYGYR